MIRKNMGLSRMVTENQYANRDHSFQDDLVIKHGKLHKATRGGRRCRTISCPALQESRLPSQQSVMLMVSAACSNTAASASKTSARNPPILRPPFCSFSGTSHHNRS